MEKTFSKRIEIVKNEGTGVLINDNFNQWNSIKDEAESKKWKEATLSFSAGTYKQFNLLDMLEKFQDSAVEKGYLVETYNNEVKSLLNKEETS